jgi:nucleotide-binding universal stress UspA family protein
MRVIFIPVADRPECAVALNAAFAFGHIVGASVIGCHIRPHSDSPIRLPSNLNLSKLTDEDFEWQAASKTKDTEKARTSAKALFSRLAERHGYKLLRHPRAKPGAVWMEKTGSPNKVIGIMGPMADLLVLSRPSTKGGKLARIFLSASLLKSSRPVLVLPQTEKRTVGKRICIAWNQSVEAAQAVAATMPLLTQADRVSIVTCGAETRAGPKSGQLAAYLKYWGIQSEHVSTQGKDEPKEIVAAYKSTDSDLLLMGAYSRSRMSQLVFGGVTEYMLKRTSIPVLMLHT